MKTLLAIIAITLVIACSLEPDKGGTGTTSSSSNEQTTPSSSSEQTIQSSSSEQTTPSSSSEQTIQSSSSEQTTPSNCGQNDKCYTVTVSNGASCAVMIRKNSNSYSSYHDYTLQCPSGTKIGCMRVYDNSNFILGTKSTYVSTGLVSADGYGEGSIQIPSSKGNFESIASVSLHETSCN